MTHTLVKTSYLDLEPATTATKQVPTALNKGGEGGGKTPLRKHIRYQGLRRVVY